MTVASQVKQTLANLQNAQATLNIYALQSQDGEVRAIFHEAAEITAAIGLEVEGRLKTLEFEEPQYQGF